MISLLLFVALLGNTLAGSDSSPNNDGISLEFVNQFNVDKSPINIKTPPGLLRDNNNIETFIRDFLRNSGTDTMVDNLVFYTVEDGLLTNDDAAIKHKNIRVINKKLGYNIQIQKNGEISTMGFRFGQTIEKLFSHVDEDEVIMWGKRILDKKDESFLYANEMLMVKKIQDVESTTHDIVIRVANENAKAREVRVSVNDMSTVKDVKAEVAGILGFDGEYCELFTIKDGKLDDKANINNFEDNIKVINKNMGYSIMVGDKQVNGLKYLTKFMEFKRRGGIKGKNLFYNGELIQNTQSLYLYANEVLQYNEEYHIIVGIIAMTNPPNVLCSNDIKIESPPEISVLKKHIAKVHYGNTFNDEVLQDILLFEYDEKSRKLVHVDSMENIRGQLVAIILDYNTIRMRIGNTPDILNGDKVNSEYSTKGLIKQIEMFQILHINGNSIPLVLKYITGVYFHGLNGWRSFNPFSFEYAPTEVNVRSRIWEYHIKGNILSQYIDIKFNHLLPLQRTDITKYIYNMEPISFNQQFTEEFLNQYYNDIHKSATIAGMIPAHARLSEFIMLNLQYQMSIKSNIILTPTNSVEFRLGFLHSTCVNVPNAIMNINIIPIENEFIKVHTTSIKCSHIVANFPANVNQWQYSVYFQWNLNNNFGKLMIGTDIIENPENSEIPAIPITSNVKISELGATIQRYRVEIDFSNLPGADPFRNFIDMMNIRHDGFPILMDRFNFYNYYLRDFVVTPEGNALNDAVKMKRGRNNKIKLDQPSRTEGI